MAKRKGGKKKPNYKLRAYNAALRMIATQDGISLAEAKKNYPRARIEVIWSRPGKKARARFLQVEPGIWRAYKGSPRTTNTFGPLRDVAYMKRVRAMETYWSTIRILADTFGLSEKEAREYYKKTAKELGEEDAKKYILEEIGIYSEQSPPLRDEEDEDESEDEEDENGDTDRPSRASKRTGKGRKRSPDNTKNVRAKRGTRTSSVSRGKGKGPKGPRKPPKGPRKRS